MENLKKIDEDVIRIPSFGPFSLRDNEISLAVLDYEHTKNFVSDANEIKRLEGILKKALTINELKVRDLSLNFENVDLVRTPQDILDIMKVRSIAYKSVGNDSELCDPLTDLNYDCFDDGHSLILKYLENQKIVGTSRLILDSEMGLFSEEKFDPINGFNKLRKEALENGKRIAELSRTCILPENQKGHGFKRLMGSIYETAIHMNIETLITTVRNYDTTMYTRFGMEVIGEIDYGKIKDCEVLAWKIPENVSPLFQKGILKRRVN